MPALVENGRVILPEFSLDRDIEYRTGRLILSAAQYNAAMDLPTLAELRHAYFGRNADGSFVAPQYRQNVLSKRGYGEWTSTFIQNGRHVVERPEYIECRNGAWKAEGGKIVPVELPPDGWAVEYDEVTGLPSRTSQNRNDGEAVFGTEASYFHTNRTGTRSVARFLDISGFGPFSIYAAGEPDNWDLHTGARSCHRL